MELKEIQKFLPLLHSMRRCGCQASRNIIMSHLDEPSFAFLTKWINRGVQEPQMLNLPPRRLKSLKKALEVDRAKIKYITKKGGSPKRKRLAVRQSGSGIGLLLGVLAPIVISLVKDLITKGKNKEK